MSEENEKLFFLRFVSGSVRSTPLSRGICYGQTAPSKCVIVLEGDLFQEVYVGGPIADPEPITGSGQGEGEEITGRSYDGGGVINHKHNPLP